MHIPYTTFDSITVIVGAITIRRACIFLQLNLLALTTSNFQLLLSGITHHVDHIFQLVARAMCIVVMTDLECTSLNGVLHNTSALLKFCVNCEATF